MAQELVKNSCAGTSETDWRSILFLGGDKRGAYTPGFAASAPTSVGRAFTAEKAGNAIATFSRLQIET
jgi:hypothetical protein